MSPVEEDAPPQPIEAIHNQPTRSLGLFLYKVELVTFYLLLVAWKTGAFTDGLPPYYTCQYVVAAVYNYTLQLRCVYILFWFDTRLINITLTQAALRLQQNPWMVWLLFVLICYFIAQIAIFHQTTSLAVHSDL